MQIGYVHASIHNQDLALQREALQQAQCDIIYEGKVSGAHGSREGLTLALVVLRKDGSLVVWKLDRHSVHFISLTLPDQYLDTFRTFLFSYHGQPGVGGTRSDGGTDMCRVGSCPQTRPHWWPQTQDDRLDNQRRKTIVARWHGSEGYGAEPRSLREDVRSPDTGIRVLKPIDSDPDSRSYGPSSDTIPCNLLVPCTTKTHNHPPPGRISP